MTSPIKPPAGSPPIPALGKAVGPSGSDATGDAGAQGAEFAAALESQSTPALEGGSPLAGADGVSALAAELRAGSLSPAEALETLVQQALGAPEVALLAPAQRAELEAHLRSTLAEDPSMRDLVSDLKGA